MLGYDRTMRCWLNPRSRVSRSLLILGLLAWTALPFDAFAHSLAMAGEMDTDAPMMAMDTAAASHCPGMSMTHGPQTPHASHPAPAHPTHNGHGCCAGHGCYCASLFSGIAGVPSLSLTWQPTHGVVLIPVRVAPRRTHAAPPLRPPIS